MVIFLLLPRFLPTLFMLFVFEKLQRTEVNQKAIKKRVRTECESCAMRETIYTKKSKLKSSNTGNINGKPTIVNKCLNLNKA